jgi:hypothetical protein
MARSEQNEGSTKTKFPEYNGTWNLNHVEWLVEKFERHVGEIKASDVRKKGFSKISYEEYRKLLELAVKNKQAYSNGRPVSHNKYAIYFNSGNSFFDDELLLDTRIANLPPESCQILTVDGEKLKSWYETKTYWTYVYLLFCGLQKEGKVDLDILPDWLDLNAKRLLVGEAQMYIHVYKALKFGWDEMPRVYTSYKDNYNVIFLDILLACSCNTLLIKYSGFKPISPRYRYEYLQQVNQDLKKQELKNRSQDSDISFLDREKQDELIRKFFGKEFDRLGKQVKEHSDRFNEMCGVLKKMLATSNDPVLHQILSEWKAAEKEKEYVDAYLGQSRLLKDKPRLEKRNAKARKKRGFEV